MKWGGMTCHIFYRMEIIVAGYGRVWEFLEIQDFYGGWYPHLAKTKSFLPGWEYFVQ